MYTARIVRDGLSQARYLLLQSILCPFLLFQAQAGTTAQVNRDGLMLDLNADHGVNLEEGHRVSRWINQVPDARARLFRKRDKGRDEPGSGRPTLKTSVDRLGGHNTIVFRRQELVNAKEDVFDHLTTGSGYTWVTVLAPLPQKPGLEDVNSFVGNLKNGRNYEGFWAGFNDDNTLWAGTRNGKSFGRWDDNNPKLLGPELKTNRFYVIAARMGQGTGTASIELFVNNTKPVGTTTVPVNPNANPSRIVIGQERDAVRHPGKESFDGKISRSLIYDRPLETRELKQTMNALKDRYNIEIESSSERDTD